MTRITRLSTSESPKPDEKAAQSAAADRQDIDRFDPDNFDDYQEPKTVGQKVLNELYLDTITTLTATIYSEDCYDRERRNEWFSNFLYLRNRITKESTLTTDFCYRR